MGNCYLAIDIGASGGRHILGYMENDKIRLKEIYRFENRMINDGGNLCWDTEYLFQQIIEGLKICRQIDKIPVSMAIDTWAVDYVLLDRNDKIIGKTYAYRDHRTENMDKKIEHIISSEKLYKRTGIQKQVFNTVYQLMAFKEEYPELLDNSETFLMLPDYFSFLLTGVKKSEYTNATSTQLVNSDTKDWDWELIEKLNFNKNIFLPLNLPETVTGNFKKEIVNQVGFDCKVIMAASHDTASAVISVPETDEKNSSIYISSGTWSLMGIETDNPISTKESMNLNFSNEGGYHYKFRFLKNITGLWIIQSVRNEINKQYSFAELCKMAEDEKDFSSKINVNDLCFLSPESMIKEIQSYCEKTGQIVPRSISEIASVVYNSLADSYNKTAEEIEKITGKKYEQIHIIGGGSNADYLNQLTANRTGKTVYAGPAEASSAGNIIVQMIQNKEFSTLKEAKKIIYKSFEIKKYRPLANNERRD